MTINNLGAARLGLGQVNGAEQAFTDALAQDPLYPPPHLNLAIVHELRGNRVSLFSAIGDSIVTRPTRNNVRDLRILPTQ